ncbi:uncharacterized protein LOC129004333 isoform X1 [Macrosteles quadrilineatus]|uniref:uncharacterized protein LOC129004333 isoform X1 n=1 Tax=Macrosteles quadrilineatus TaxID=74068 RepID=UPI0023E334A7|nr:uncharacterized protein LOC129004333 isoform X1 [Macrosteles quadrilineatus]
MTIRVILLVLVASPLANCLISLEDVGDIISFAHEVVIDVLQAWKLVKPFVEGEGPQHIDLPIIKSKEKQILSRIALVTDKVEQVDKMVQSVTSASMLNLKQDIPSQIRLELRIDTLLDLISMMNFADHNFKQYADIDNGTEFKIERHTLESFASFVVSHNPNSVLGILDRLHTMIHPDLDQGQTFLHTGILEQIRHVLQEGENSLCHVQQSPHQIIYNLYNSLQMTQLKGYTMMQFSWMLLRLYKKGNFTTESRLMRERYLERMAEQAISLKEALKEADSAYWKCDPKHQVEGETYIQLTRLLQGYIQNEVDMNPKQTCSENCGYYQMTKQHSCYENQFCAKQRACQGDIVECQYIDSDMWVCQADPTVSKRRYDWIEYENGRVLGNKGSCHRTSKVDSWWRWLFWHCSYCFCMCDDPTNSDRYFSLRNVLSDTDNNKVVTGIRFVKMNGVVHMQIQEGSLGRYGHINGTSWQSVDNFKTKDTIEGKDYMKMSYYKRAIDLDDLLAPPEHVITGVKFRMVGSHLNLEIRATPFNFTSGQLLDPGRKDQWLSNDNTDGSPVKPRTKVSLDSADNPLHSLSPSRIDSKSDQYLLFTHSDIDLDAAQTTVPFIDSQMVSPQPPVPLSGIGVYHKGVRWFGGFIGLKVFTYDFGNHIEDSFTDLNGIDTVN